MGIIRVRIDYTFFSKPLFFKLACKTNLRLSLIDLKLRLQLRRNNLQKIAHKKICTFELVEFIYSVPEFLVSHIPKPNIRITMGVDTFWIHSDGMVYVWANPESFMPITNRLIFFRQLGADVTQCRSPNFQVSSFLPVFLCTYFNALCFAEERNHSLIDSNVN